MNASIVRAYPLTAISLVNNKLSVSSYFSATYTTPEEPSPGNLLNKEFQPSKGQSYLQGVEYEDLVFLSFNLNDTLNTRFTGNHIYHFAAEISALTEEQRAIIKTLSYGGPHGSLMGKYGIEELELTLHETSQFDGTNFLNAYNCVLAKKATISCYGGVCDMKN